MITDEEKKKELLNLKVKNLLETIHSLNEQVDALGWRGNPSIMIHGADLKILKEILGDDLVLGTLFVQDSFRSVITGDLKSLPGVDLFHKDTQ